MTRRTALAVLTLTALLAASAASAGVRRLLYVTYPDGAMRMRSGGGAIYVYDIDDGHKLIRRIDAPWMGGTRGCCASAEAGKLYITHSNTKIACVDMVTGEKVWENVYEKSEGGCDRACVTPDGRKVYVPEGWWSRAAPWLKVLDGRTGKLLKKIPMPYTNAHNMFISLDGKRAYCGSTTSGILVVIDTATDRIIKQFGPKKGRVSPYVVNGAETLAFVNNRGVAFTIYDLVGEKVLDRIEVRPKNFSHGVGLTPDEKEIWLPDPAEKKLHIFDATVMPPRPVGSIPVSSKTHGWITFSIAGDYAWCDTGDVIDPKTKKIVATWKDENGRQIGSSKFIEVHFADGRPVRTGDQFGLGRVRPKGPGGS